MSLKLLLVAWLPQINGRYLGKDQSVRPASVEATKSISETSGCTRDADFVRAKAVVRLHGRIAVKDVFDLIEVGKIRHMQSIDPIEAREAELVKIAESSQDTAALRHHLTEIIEGAVFKGSHRSGQFLRYIVEQALAGQFDSLKERVIGMELFGRTPSYDTSEDAIVRVTASDVRKRLLQHYGKYGASSEFRVSLPLGSYVPDITRHGHANEVQAIPADPQQTPAAAPTDPGTIHGDSAPPLPLPVVPDLEAASARSPGRFQLLVFAIIFLVLNLSFWGIFWKRSSHTNMTQAVPLPWSVLLNPAHATHLITSDPNIVVVQGITGAQLSVSDYANHKYIPEANQLTPETIRLSHAILWGDNSAAAVDAPIAATIGALAQASSSKIDVRAARSIQLSDLKTDDNFIFLGSPRSDPWSALFDNELDFRFAFDRATRQEVILNIHPHPQELTTYVPTALGWATGQSFAIIALVQNPDQNGSVLLLAGANGEGTEAAGRLATDPGRLSPMLKKCGIDPLGPLQNFELLLHLNTMAGSPNNIDVVACHIMPGTTVKKP